MTERSNWEEIKGRRADSPQRRKGYEAGIRRGYALALGEHDEATWPSDAKRRTAA